MANKKQEQIATDDAVLLMFLSLVEEDGLEVDVILNVNGAIISGTLIGPSAYYEGTTEASKQIQDQTLAKIMTKKFNDMKEAYTKQKQEQAEKADKESTATFIHLKNARYLGADGQPNGESRNWWRGRISSVDGFSFGTLGQN